MIKTTIRDYNWFYNGIFSIGIIYHSKLSIYSMMISFIPEYYLEIHV